MQTHLIQVISNGSSQTINQLAIVPHHSIHIIQFTSLKKKPHLWPCLVPSSQQKKYEECIFNKQYFEKIYTYIYYYQKKTKVFKKSKLDQKLGERFVQIELYSHLVWRSEYCAYHGDRKHRPTATTRITSFSSSSENCISHANRNRGTKMHAHHLFWQLWDSKADKYAPSSGQRWPGQHNIVGTHVVLY